MFLTLVRIFPSAKELEAVRLFLMGLLEPTRVQPGCLGCTLATESDPEALLYMETWQSMEHLLPRLRSEEYGKVLATMELSTSKPDVWIYEISNEQGLELIERARLVSTNQDEAAP
jgi:quinol monooxygenase YgiN